MTFAIGHVEGGTNAGRRRLDPTVPQPWFCACFEVEPSQPEVAVAKLNPRYLTRCTDCGEKRPK